MIGLNTNILLRSVAQNAPTRLNLSYAPTPKLLRTKPETSYHKKQ